MQNNLSNNSSTVDFSKKRKFFLKKNFNKENKKTYFLIGTPNVGKSTFFNRVTWKTSQVSNIDKTTTVPLLGNLRSDKTITIVDLPGIYSLNTVSEDENVVINYLLNNKTDGVINLVNANSPQRDLLLTLDIAEANLLKEIVINMIDDVGKESINEFGIFNKFKVPVALISAKKNLNIRDVFLKTMLLDKVSNLKVKYHEKIEEFINVAIGIIPDLNFSKRFFLIQYLLENKIIVDLTLKNKINQKLEDLKNKYLNNFDVVNSIIKTKNDYVKKELIPLFNKKINNPSLLKKQKRNSKINNFLDKVVLNKYASVIIFIIIIALVFYLTFGSYAGGWIQSKFSDDFLGMIQTVITNAMIKGNASLWATSFVSSGLFGGIFTVLGFIPWIIIITFFMTILEQIGYFSRVSVSFDKAFEKFGLSGRSFVNLITGIGCNIPSIMMARNCHSKKERIISILITPLISCSARIVVFGWIGQALINDDLNWLFVYGLVIFSGIVTLSFGMFFSKTMFKNKSTFFMTEIPKWRLPDIFVILKKVWFELWDFIKRIILIIFIVNLIVWFLTYTGPIKGTLDLSIKNNEIFIQKNSQNLSWIYYISEGLRYLFLPLGFGKDWRIVASLISAFPAKELAASNLEILFNGQDGFLNYFNSLNQLRISTIISFLIFLSFYTPCVSATLTIKKETNKKIMGIHILAAFFITYIFSMLGFSIVGSIERFIWGINLISSTDISIIVIFSLILFFIIFLFSSKIPRVYYLKKNKNQNYLLNKFALLSNNISIGIIIALSFALAILLII